MKEESLQLIPQKHKRIIRNYYEELYAKKFENLDEMDLIDIYSLSSQRSKMHIQMHIFKDRPHERTQNKPQQIQENWNHIKHFLQPQGTETRNQPQGKNPKTLKIVETE